MRILFYCPFQFNLKSKLENSKEIQEAFGNDTIKSYLRLKRSEIENFEKEETFDKKSPVTDWEKNSTLDC